MKNHSPNVSSSGSFLLGGDIKVNRLGFGAMRLTGPGVWGEPQNRDQAQKVLLKAIEWGINFIDTADSYGPEVSENMIAETLYPYPKDLVIATKGGLVRPGMNDWKTLGRPEYLMQCVEMSLRRLKSERIDLYQLHAVDPLVPIEDSLGALKKMQEQGKIRHIGLSNVSVAQIEKAKKIVDIASVQNEYNLKYRHSEDVLKYCEKHSLGFIPWYPIDCGHFAKTGGYLDTLAKQKGVTSIQLAIQWLLKQSKVMLPIPGTSSLEHLQENCLAAEIYLTDEEYAQMSLVEG